MTLWEARRIGREACRALGIYWSCTGHGYYERAWTPWGLVSFVRWEDGAPCRVSYVQRGWRLEILGRRALGGRFA